jgi:hypothetical protein
MYTKRAAFEKENPKKMEPLSQVSWFTLLSEYNSQKLMNIKEFIKNAIVN